MLHWHGDTFDLPQDATRLAESKLYENQAFAFGPYALALQFHIETDPRGLEQWDVGHAFELATAGAAISGLRTAAHERACRLEAQARTSFTEWLRQIDQFVARDAATRTGSSR